MMSKRSSYLFDSIDKGILCQVAKEAYSLSFTSHYYDSSSYGHECPPAACRILLCQSNDPPDRPSLDEIHHERRGSLVVLQKGQMLPYEGIKMMIYIKYDKLQVKNALYTQLRKYQKQGDFPSTESKASVYLQIYENYTCLTTIMAIHKESSMPLYLSVS